MAIKMSQYSATDRYCCLVLDEVQISQGFQYDLSLKQFAGNVSAELRGSSEVEKKHAASASHVLCYMAKGITKKWKQVVGM